LGPISFEDGADVGIALRQSAAFTTGTTRPASGKLLDQFWTSFAATDIIADGSIRGQSDHFGAAVIIGNRSVSASPKGGSLAKLFRGFRNIDVSRLNSLLPEKLGIPGPRADEDFEAYSGRFEAAFAEAIDEVAPIISQTHQRRSSTRKPLTSPNAPTSI
jgi:hypothetical protein